MGILVDQSADEHELHRHPDRSSPVGVAPKHPAVRIARDIANAVLLSASVKDIGVFGVEARQRANPERTQELVLVEHVAEYPAEFVRIDQGKDPPATSSHLQRN